MTEWIRWVRERAAAQPSALVTVLATEGSAPRGAGTRMLVTADAEFGTIGGGRLEHEAIAQARAIFGHAPGGWRVQDYPLGPLLGQCCGGRVRLLIEHVDPGALDWAEESEGGALLTTLAAEGVRRERCEALPTSLSARGERPGAGSSFVEAVETRRRPLCLFGAGHVGQAVARLALDLPFRLAWFDTRADRATIDRVTLVDADSIEQCVAEAPAEAAILILTHDHALDYRLALASLRRPPVAFVGLIGSATKRARFLSRLEQDGVDAPARARLVCPIGVPGIASKEPAAIAVAAVAQLLQLGPA